MHEAGICFNDGLTLPRFWPRAESIVDARLKIDTQSSETSHRFVAPALEEFSLPDLKRGSASARSLPGSVGAGLAGRNLTIRELSYRCVGAAVDVERPLEGCLAGGADESGGLQDRSHALRGVNESAERVLV